MQLQVIYTEALESSRLFRRKALNSTQGKGVLSVWFFRRGAGSAGRMYQSDLHTSRWLAGLGRLA